MRKWPRGERPAEGAVAKTCFGGFNGRQSLDFCICFVSLCEEREKQVSMKLRFFTIGQKGDATPSEAQPSRGRVRWYVLAAVILAVAGAGAYVGFRVYDKIKNPTSADKQYELAVKAGIPSSPRTRGAVVDQTRMTAAEGIFAAGNVLHVHDLADYAAEEAEEAGRAAARYIAEGARAVTAELSLQAGNGIGYVMPQRITLPADEVKVFFRVSNPVKSPTFRVVSDGKVLLTRKRIAAFPGEMETLTLTKEMLAVQNPV